MSKRCVVLLTLAAGVWLAGAPVALAQQTAQIAGRVTDPTGAVIPGAEIAVNNEETGIRRETNSNELGYYSVPILPPGKYRVSVHKDGFRPITRTGMTLEVDQAARIDFVMEVGLVSESVEVTANVSTVDLQTATLKSVVDERRIRELPLNGRDATQLVALVPGIYGTNDTSGLRQGSSAPNIVQPGFAANGARGNMVNYALDGASHNDTYTNVALAFPNPDALQEFSVQTNNFSAEFGRSAGAIVNAVTRSGTNAVHGSLFEFLRNANTNARNFFATQTDGLKRNQFGGTVGGPVYIPRVYNGKDRTFFFFSEQETRQVQTPSGNITVVPTAAQRIGDFSARSQAVIDPLNNQAFPGNRIPSSREDAVARNVIEKLLPLPTQADTGLLNYTVPNTNSGRQVVLRIDHNPSSKDTVTGRYLYNYYHVPPFASPLVFAVVNELTIPNHNLSLSETHIFSPTLLNQAQFSLNRRTSTGQEAWLTNFGDLGMKNVRSETHVFNLSVNGAFTASAGGNSITSPNDYTAADTLRWTAGRHEISLGFEYRYQWLHKSYSYLLNPSMTFAGNYSGYGVSDFFLGLSSQLQQSAFGEKADQHFPTYVAFVQDNIRVTPRLTVNLGVRYEPFIPYVDDGNRTALFRPGSQSRVYTNAPPGLLFVGDPGVPRGGTPVDYSNIAPRVGFAWAPFGNARTSVRGAYGVFYDASPESAITNIFETGAPYGTRVALVPPPGPLSDPYAGNSPFPLPFPPPRDVFFPQSLIAATWPNKFKTAYIQSFHLTVEREVHRDWVVRLAYAGSKGTHLMQGWEENPAIYIPGQSTTANTLSRRPYGPAFQNITVLDSTGNSSFNSMQVSMDKRFSHGFTIFSNYTWAKSIDQGSGAGTLWPSYANPFNFAFNRGPSDFQHAQRFVTSGLWQLPRPASQSALVQHLLGGWMTSGVLSLQSGAPYSVNSGLDNSRSGVGADRSDLIGNTSRSARQDPNRDPVLEWFNTKAFAQNALGTFGTSGRNIIIGPGLANVDFSLAKDFILYRESRLQFRAEAFNLFNRPNFAGPRSDSLTSGTYGRLTSALDPRILQFALKLMF